MVKYFLKNTDQEVKIGNKITISYPVRTPYGESKHEFDVLVTQESLRQLIKDNLVEAREVGGIDFNVYRPFVKRLARRMGTSLSVAADFLDAVKEVSPFAHNCLLIDLMAEVFNRDKKFGDRVYSVNMTSGLPVGRTGSSFDEPVFADLDDAKRAIALITPFVIAARHDGK